MNIDNFLLVAGSVATGWIGSYFKNKDTRTTADKDLTLKTYEILESRMVNVEKINASQTIVIEELKDQLRTLRANHEQKEADYKKELDDISRKLTITEHKLDKAIALLESNNIKIEEDIKP